MTKKQKKTYTKKLKEILLFADKQGVGIVISTTNGCVSLEPGMGDIECSIDRKNVAAVIGCLQRDFLV